MPQMEWAVVVAEFERFERLSSLHWVRYVLGDDVDALARGAARALGLPAPTGWGGFLSVPGRPS